MSHLCIVQYLLRSKLIYYVWEKLKSRVNPDDRSKSKLLEKYYNGLSAKHGQALITV